MSFSQAVLPAFHAFAPKIFADMLGSRKEASATFAGAALFVDMSDYTSLAETLCREGSDGRERLGQILDQTFSRHVACVYRAGGEIAGFMGDGVLACWPAGGNSIIEPLASAEDCASALHRAQRDLAASAAIVPELHIGIAAGDLWAARLGGVDRVWHQVLAGRAAREAFEAGDRAKPGETIVARRGPGTGPKALQTPGLADGVTPFARDGSGRKEGQEDLREDVVPRMLRDWWADHRRHWLPQLRMISAVFVKIDGLPAECDGALLSYQRATTALQRAIRTYSASPGTLLVDDKGLIFKLFFGMPYNSHRDDAVQALKAALAIRSALGDIGLSASIGIADGEGVCMPIGAEERLDYTAIGRFAHLAARLMSLPGRAVLCTAEIAARADGRMVMTARPSMALKGVDQPMAVFAAEAAPPAPARQRPLIGRETEMALIEDHLDRLRAGQGAVLHIVGDAGIGKTALVDHVVDITRSSHLTTLVGQAQMSEVVLPFLSWRPVFAQLLGVSVHADMSGAGAAGARSRLDGLPEDERRFLPLINAVLPDLADTNSAVDRLSGEARVEATLSFLARLIRYLAPPGFVLVLEDCHWMDSASWRLLERLRATSHDMLILLTSRPRPDQPGLDAIRAQPRFRDLPLAPLPVEAIREIIRLSAPAGPMAGDDLDWVDRAADFASGNPLFAKEFAYLMAAGKAVPAPPGPPPRRGRGGMAWPTTLQGLITSRLDSLRPPELLMLKAASVIGSQFDLTLLGRVVPDQPQPKTLLQRMADLLGHHLVLAIDRAARIYRFQHDLIREVVYGQLTRDQRRLLHNRAAAAIEEVHRDNLATQFAALADHWSKAADGSKTLRYAELAVEQALRSGGYAEARRLLGLCFEHAHGEARHLVPTARRMRWYRLSADTQFGLGNLAERSKDADAALRIAGMARARSRPRQVMGALAGLAAWGGRRMLGGQGAPADAGTSELSQELARVHRHHAAIAWFSSDPIAMTAHSIAALRQAERGGASDVLAGASVEFGGILGLLGLRAFGRALMRRALVIAEQVDERSMLTYVRLLTCLYEVGVGNWPVVDRHALEGERLAEAIGDRVNWSNVQAVRFWSRYYRNELAAAEGLARRFAARQEAEGNDQHRAWAHRFTALCALRRQRPDIAREHLEQASAHLAGSGAANDTLPAIGLLALARYRCGERTNAVQAALEGFSLIEDVGRPTGHAMLEGYAALTEVAFHALMDDPQSATWQAAFAQCLGGLNRFQRVFPIGRPRYRLWLALDLALKGRSGASRRQFSRAQALARRLGMSWERDLAAMALAVGPERFLRDLRAQTAGVDSGSGSG